MVLLQGRPQLHLLTQPNPLLRYFATGMPAGAQLVKKGAKTGFWARSRSLGPTQIQFPSLGSIHLQIRSFSCTRPAIHEAKMTRLDILLFLLRWKDPPRLGHRHGPRPSDLSQALCIRVPFLFHLRNFDSCILIL